MSFIAELKKDLATLLAERDAYKKVLEKISKYQELPDGLTTDWKNCLLHSSLLASDVLIRWKRK